MTRAARHLSGCAVNVFHGLGSISGVTAMLTSGMSSPLRDYVHCKSCSQPQRRRFGRYWGNLVLAHSLPVPPSVSLSTSPPPPLRQPLTPGPNSKVCTFLNKNPAFYPPAPKTTRTHTHKHTHTHTHLYNYITYNCQCEAVDTGRLGRLNAAHGNQVKQLTLISSTHGVRLLNVPPS